MIAYPFLYSMSVMSAHNLKAHTVEYLQIPPYSVQLVSPYSTLVLPTAIVINTANPWKNGTAELNIPKSSSLDLKDNSILLKFSLWPLNLHQTMQHSKDLECGWRRVFSTVGGTNGVTNWPQRKNLLETSVSCHLK